MRTLLKQTTSSALATSLTEKMRVDAEQEMQQLERLIGNKKSVKLLTERNDVLEFVDKNIDTILFDCDGVLYRSPEPAPGAVDCIDSLLRRNKKIYFVTNNAGSNRSQLRDKLHSCLKMDSLTEDMMISSSYSCARYLQDKVGTGSLYVIGSQGLCDELRQVGFEVSGGPSPVGVPPSMSRDDLAAYDFSEHPIDAVVVGHDIDFNFRKLCIANVLLQLNPGALLVATNRDSFDLVGADARQIPGNGCVVTALEYCSKRTAINVGKPSEQLFRLIAKESGLDPARTMIVGDRLDTDVKFGVDHGMYSALVMTGVTSAKQLHALGDGTTEEPLPSHVLTHVGLLA